MPKKTLITYHNITDTISGWERRTGIDRNEIKRRLDANLPLDIILRREPKFKQLDTYIYKGISLNLNAWARVMGLVPCTLADRFHMHGWSLERALTESPMTPSQRAKRNATLQKLFARLNPPGGVPTLPQKSRGPAAPGQ